MSVVGRWPRERRASSCWSIFPAISPGSRCARCRGTGNTHAGRPTSHYGRVYNFLCFNDGYHAEHHADPAIHWTALPHRSKRGAAASPWPPLLRWLDLQPLELLEHLVLQSPACSASSCIRHRRAFQALLPQAGDIRRVTIVGGGLFPRTALILRELLPGAQLTIVDSNPRNLETARAFLDGDIEYPQRVLSARRIARLRSDRDSLLSSWRPRRHLSPSTLPRRARPRLDLAPPPTRSRHLPPPAQTPQPDYAQGTAHRQWPGEPSSPEHLALALLPILLLAKLLMISAHPAPLTASSLLAYTWQDACVALAFAAFEFVLPSRISRPSYWALVLYAAINIPVARVLSTPLTRPMLRAARGPLADSILLYVTAANIAIVLSVLAAAALLPRLLRRVPRIWILALLPLVLLGPAASRRADTRGMDRNAITALIGSRVPPAPAGPEAHDWRSSPFPSRYETAGLARYAGAARGFNVVLVSLESTAAQYLALYSAPGSGQPDAMPNLSALARHSLVFENAYAVYPESIKGLFSVLCSTFPAFDSRPEAYENIGPPSLAAVLAGAGYRTAMFHSGRFGYLGMESIIRNRGYQLLEDAGNISGNHNSSFGVDEPATVARILSWLDTLPRGQNFFLTYLPIAGHHPYATPDPGPFAVTAEVDQYRNALHFGDASLGTLVEGLRARGLEQNTIWIVYGDHGEAFGQHNGNYGHTFLLYDENVHVPFLIAAPGLMRGQQRVRKVVSLVDTAPTVLALLGIPPPANYQGATTLDTAPRMALFFADYSLGLLGLRDGPWKFVYELNSKRAKTLRPRPRSRRAIRHICATPRADLLVYPDPPRLEQRPVNPGRFVMWCLGYIIDTHSPIARPVNTHSPRFINTPSPIACPTCPPERPNPSRDRQGALYEPSRDT